MKKNIFQLFAILLFLDGIFKYTRRRIDRTLDTKVADILAQMPTKDLVHRDRVMAEIVELGPEGFKNSQNFLSLLEPVTTLPFVLP